MPLDLMLMTNINSLNLSKDEIVAIGGVNYIFEPYKNDLQFDNLGRLKTVENVSKTVQNVIKILLSDVGRHIEDLEYGSLLNTFIGEKRTAAVFVEINDTIEKALNKYNELNFDNPSSDEYLDSIVFVQALGDKTDPRIVYIKIIIELESGKQIDLSVPVGDS